MNSSRTSTSEHCSGPSTSENGKIWQKSGFSPFWLHWFLCGWACRGCVHNCCRACMCAVLSWLCACICISSCLPLCQSVSVSLRRGQLSACWELMKTQRCQKGLCEKNMVGAAQRLQISVDSVKNVLTNLSKKTQVGFTNNQDGICHGSIHTIFNILVVCSFNVAVESVRDCIF